jgi:hypothetical protein
MATPRIILRFRELTPGVDTVRAHVAVIEKFGYVWWGWWKKQTEPDHSEALRIAHNTLKHDDRIFAWLIDTSAERLHLATITAIESKLPNSETEKVPSYYRDAKNIPVWFRIESIEPDRPYARELEAKIGQNTLAIFSGG